MKILYKSWFFEDWKKGVLGNRTSLWDNPLEAYQAAKERNIEIGFREVGKAGGGAWCRVPSCDVLDIASEWTKCGRKFLMDDGVPNHHSTLQGEVCRTFEGLQSYLAVGFPIPPMRISMKLGLHKHRGYLETKELLDRYMDPSSRDDLEMLLELYPDATVEFTCFDIDVGNIPSRNTMMWEVRDY